MVTPKDQPRPEREGCWNQTKQEGRIMQATDRELRQTAAEWHGGQFSPLYAFQSTGAIASDLWAEVRDARKLAETDEDRAALDALAAYVEAETTKWEAANPDAEDYPDWIRGPQEESC